MVANIIYESKNRQIRDFFDKVAKLILSKMTCENTYTGWVFLILQLKH